MGGIGGDVTEERIVFVRFDKVQSFRKEHIGAVTLVFFRLAIVPVGIIKIIVATIIGTLGNSTSPVAYDFMEAPVPGTKRIVVAQMPFTEHAIGVSVLGKYLGQYHFILK